jgi:hypothetical protein
MHSTMTGWHEIRLTGPGREQFRLFCRLEKRRRRGAAAARAAQAGDRGHHGYA